MSNTEHKKTDTVVWDESTRSWNWWTIITHALLACGGKTSLRTLHRVIKRHPRIASCPEWRKDVAWVLRNYNDFFQSRRNVWSYMLVVTPEQRRKSDELRARLIDAGILPER